MRAPVSNSAHLALSASISSLYGLDCSPLTSTAGRIRSSKPSVVSTVVSPVWNTKCASLHVPGTLIAALGSVTVTPVPLFAAVTRAQVPSA